MTKVTDFELPVFADETDPDPERPKVSPLTILLNVFKSELLTVVFPFYKLEPDNVKGRVVTERVKEPPESV